MFFGKSNNQAIHKLEYSRILYNADEHSIQLLDSWSGHCVATLRKVLLHNKKAAKYRFSQ